jgi:hypothetical protein
MSANRTVQELPLTRQSTRPPFPISDHSSTIRPSYRARNSERPVESAGQPFAGEPKAYPRGEL